MEKLNAYRKNINDKLDLIMDTQSQTLVCIKDILKEVVSTDHIIHMFGTGHSHAISVEFFYRAGGFACVNAILDEPVMVHAGATASTKVERLENYAPIILDKYVIEPRDALIIFSNSVVNAVPVEMALCAKEKGLTVIAFTSVRHSKSVNPRNSFGKRLFEVADYYIDTLADVGDASVELASGQRCAPISTVICDTLLNGMLAQIADELIQEGVEVPIFASANIAGGDSKNEKYLEKYHTRIKHL